MEEIKMEEQVMNDKQILILETAEKLFAINSYDATSIRDIANSGSFNSAMISYYFGSKEQLMEGILKYRTTKLELILKTTLSAINDPLEKIFALTEFYLQKVFQQNYFYLLMFQIQSLPEKHQLIKKFYNSLRFKNFQILDGIIRHGQAENRFKKDVDTSLLLFVISGTVNTLIVNQDYYREVNKIEEMSEENFIAFVKNKANVLLKGLIRQIVVPA